MAQEKQKFRGILSNQEIDPSVTWRDPRNLRQKFSDFMADPSSFMSVMGFMIGLFIFLPALGEFWFLVSVWLIRYSAKN